MTLLSSVIFFPLAGALVIFCLPRLMARQAFPLALSFTLLTALIALAILGSFDPSVAGFQLTEKAAWIPGIGASYSLGIDTLSLPMVLLTALLFAVACAASSGIRGKQKEYFALLLILETGVMGSFLALDLFLFYIFWELVLIPMYFLIGIFGGERKNAAAIKFFLYTLTGSLLMLFGIAAVYLASDPHTFDLPTLLHHPLSLGLQKAAFFAFFIGFAVKVPVFPFHTWLPEAHVEAPAPISVLLAGILLKMGAYGLLRFCFPLFPEAAEAFRPVLLILAAAGIIYGGFAALAQKDLKKMIAYSSVSHMGFVLLGIAVWTPAGLRGAVLQMISHGLITSGLFLLTGMLYERTHTREIAEFGGLARIMPHTSALFIFFAMASLGLPGLSGFPAEFLILAGTVAEHPAAAAAACAGILLSAVYLVTMTRKVFWGTLPERWSQLSDVRALEAVSLLPLVLLILAAGLYPSAFTSFIEASLQPLLHGGPVS